MYYGYRAQTKMVDFQRLVSRYPKERNLKLEHQGWDATDYVFLYCIYKIFQLYFICCIYSNRISAIGFGVMWRNIYTAIAFPTGILCTCVRLKSDFFCRICSLSTDDEIFAQTNQAYDRCASKITW